jgi:hypothetical protein
MQSKPAPAPIFINDLSKERVQHSAWICGGGSCVSVHSAMIRQDLGLNRLVRHIGECFAHKLHRPLGDPARRVQVSDNLPQWE